MNLRKLTTIIIILIFTCMITACSKETTIIDNNKLYEKTLTDLKLENTFRIEYVENDTCYIHASDDKVTAIYAIKEDVEVTKKLEIPISSDYYLRNFRELADGTMVAGLNTLDWEELKVVVYDQDKNVIREFALPTSEERNGTELFFQIIDKKGNVVIYSQDNNLLETNILVYNILGEKTHEFECESVPQDFFLYEEYIGYVSAGEFPMLIDLENNKMKSLDKFSVKLPGNESYPIISTTSYDLMLHDENALYGIMIEDFTMEKILDFKQAGWEPEFNEIYENNGVLYGIEHIYVPEEKINHYIFNEIKEDTRKTITIAGINIDSRWTNAASRFNSQNNQIRIEIKDYAEYEKDALQKLEMDFTSNAESDLLILEGLNKERYVEKELLVDLIPYMEKDSEINKEDFFDAILQSVTIDNKMHSIPIGFTMDTLVSSTDIMDKKATLSIEDYLTIFKDYKGSDAFNITDGLGWFRQLYLLNREEFADFNSKECFFNSPLFSELLESAYQMNQDQQLNSNSISSKIATNDLMFLEQPIWNYGDAMLIEKMFQGKETYIGYPTNKNNGNSFCFQGTEIGIVNGTSNEKHAWEFVKYILSKDYQYSYCQPDMFPIRKDANEYFLNMYSATERTVLENGMEVERYEGQYGFEDFSVELEPMKPETKEKFYELVESIEHVNPYIAMEEFDLIVLEEVGDYFEDKKTLEQVVDNLQNRCSLYLKEKEENEEKINCVCNGSRFMCNTSGNSAGGIGSS